MNEITAINADVAFAFLHDPDDRGHKDPADKEGQVLWTECVAGLSLLSKKLFPDGIGGTVDAGEIVACYVVAHVAKSTLKVSLKRTALSADAVGAIKVDSAAPGGDGEGADCIHLIEKVVSVPMGTGALAAQVANDVAVPEIQEQEQQPHKRCTEMQGHGRAVGVVARELQKEHQSPSGPLLKACAPETVSAKGATDIGVIRAGEPVPCVMTNEEREHCVVGAPATGGWLAKAPVLALVCLKVHGRAQGGRTKQ